MMFNQRETTWTMFSSSVLYCILLKNWVQKLAVPCRDKNKGYLCKNSYFICKIWYYIIMCTSTNCTFIYSNVQNRKRKISMSVFDGIFNMTAKAEWIHHAESWFHSYQQGDFASRCCSSFAHWECLYGAIWTVKTNTEIKLKYVLK